MIRIDSVDEAIIAAFEQDGRLSNREIARRLDVSEGTVRQRLKKLHDGGAVRFDVLTDPGHMGIEYVAFLRISVAPSGLSAALDRLSQVPELWYVAATDGPYNVWSVICTPTAVAANDVIRAHVETLHGVTAIDARPVVRTVKFDYGEIVVPRASN